jgi:imidazole glycerol phosphate synthase glutamine amidotransferase subunit
MKIGVIHLGLGNVGSLCRCLEELGKTPKLLREADFAGVDFLVFPGVGHYAAAARALDRFGRGALLEWIGQDRPFLGICLGYQLLFEASEEASEVSGLAVFRGSCRKVPSAKRPHMGWNQLKARGGAFESFQERWMYFVHSYAPEMSPETVLSAADGDEDFSVASWRGRVGGFQFHPEKSAAAGRDILQAVFDRVG